MTNYGPNPELQSAAAYLSERIAKVTKERGENEIKLNFVPQEPTAMTDSVLLPTGYMVSKPNGGAHSGATEYQRIAAGLKAMFKEAEIIPDMRVYHSGIWVNSTTLDPFLEKVAAEKTDIDADRHPQDRSFATDRFTAVFGENIKETAKAAAR